MARNHATPAAAFRDTAKQCAAKDYFFPADHPMAPCAGGGRCVIVSWCDGSPANPAVTETLYFKQNADGSFRATAPFEL